MSALKSDTILQRKARLQNETIQVYLREEEALIIRGLMNVDLIFTQG